MDDVKGTEQVWEKGWEGHQRAQALRMAHLPLSEKLKWLEEAHALAQCLSHKKKSAI